MRFTLLTVGVFSVASLPIFALGTGSKPWVDCGFFMATSKSSSYFTSSGVLGYLSTIFEGDYNASFYGCKGAITPSTRLAVLKDEEIAKDFVYWLNNFEFGGYENFIALTNSLDSGWSWSDGTSATNTTTNWKDGEPSSAGSCAVLNAYTYSSNADSKFSSIDCDSIASAVCEIPGNQIVLTSLLF
jgi:hypothetical protein